MRICTIRLRSAPKVAPVPRNPFVRAKDNIGRSGAPPSLPLVLSVACKLFCPDVIVIYTGFMKRSLRRGDHCWWPGNVIDRDVELTYVGREEFPADVSSLSFPPKVSFDNAREGRNKAEPWICLLQLPECIHKRGVFQVTVCVEQKYWMVKPLHGSVGKNAKKRGYPDPASQ